VSPRPILAAPQYLAGITATPEVTAQPARSRPHAVPGQGAGLPVNATGLHAGSWRCTATIKDSSGVTASWTGTVVVPRLAPAATKGIGNNDFVVPARSGIPAWAIVLIILGSLILLSIWAVFLRREHNQKLGGPAGQ
jgi:hypothetical protein